MKSTAPISRESFDACMSAIANTESVVVGGQALAFWAGYYGVDLYVSEHGITQDIDILGDRKSLGVIGAALNGRTSIQNPNFISALVGTVEVNVGKDHISNIDVIHTLVGVDRNAVVQLAADVTINGHLCKVMHPMHVLQSRISNIDIIHEKRDEKGFNQASLALKVIHQYILELIKDSQEGLALKAIERVVELSKTSGAKRIKQHGVSFLDAIPFDGVPNENFQNIRRPQIEIELALNAKAPKPR